MCIRDRSQKILGFIKKHGERTALLGDFNLNPSTQSIRILENELVNLILDYKIETTRSNLYSKKTEMPIADYCFVSKDLEVKDFQVPYVEASDHLPLILEIE